MAYKGFITPNINRIEDLIRTMLTSLARYQTRLALWLIDEFDFSQFSATAIGGDSPFLQSGSKLAGFGYLMAVESDTVNDLIQVLVSEDQLDCYIMHLEIEVESNVAIASYDTFSCIFFNAPIELAALEKLKQQTIIDDYGLCETQE